MLPLSVYTLFSGKCPSHVKITVKIKSGPQTTPKIINNSIIYSSFKEIATTPIIIVKPAVIEPIQSNMVCGTSPLIIVPSTRLPNANLPRSTNTFPKFTAIL
jgi:hypothetical protein